MNNIYMAYFTQAYPKDICKLNFLNKKQIHKVILKNNMRRT